MASVSEIINELESTKSQLEAAKTASDGAREQTAEMITQAEGMELEDTAESLRTLKASIESFGGQIVGLASGVDELVTAAEAIRNNASS